MLVRVIRAALLACLLPLTLVACGGASGGSGTDARGGAVGAGNAGRVVLAAGDIASCASPGDKATARLLAGSPGTILTLGDNAYEKGSAAEYSDCYGPTWGRFESRTEPAPGNHEYYTPGAAGYFGYFGEAAGDPEKGYYSYDLGAWHLVALNSNCAQVGGCGASSPQGRWLRKDLVENRERCTLAYFHHPLFSSGRYAPGLPEAKPFWEALYAAGADVVLNGHDHNYQRFAPQDPEGRADPKRGVRQFVVGTGGASHYEIEEPTANAQSHDDGAFGVLKLTLRPGSYGWEFVPVAGETFADSGAGRCH